MSHLPHEPRPVAIAEGATMTQFFHGGRAMIAHSGLCLTTDFRAAVAYSEGRGDKVFAIMLRPPWKNWVIVAPSDDIYVLRSRGVVYSGVVTRCHTSHTSRAPLR